MHQPIKSLLVLNSADRKLSRALKNILGFFPGNIRLYKTALRHSSAAKELKDGVKDSYERLEYLGDAVLGSVVAHYLFSRFPYKDEGYLTKMRSRMVSRNMIGKLARKFGIDKMVEVDRATAKYSGSISGDAFEALIGAVYLDKGYKKTQKFIIARIIDVHLDMHQLDSIEVDFKSRLIEWTQKEKKQYEFVTREEGEGKNKLYYSEVLINGEMAGSGKDYFKKGAEQNAAENALSKIVVSL